MEANQIRLSAKSQKILGVNPERYRPPEFSSIMDDPSDDNLGITWRIAVVLTGKINCLQTVEQALSSFQREMIAKYSEQDFDLFISTWDDLSTQEVNYLRQRYRVKRIQLDSWTEWMKSQDKLLPKWTRRLPDEDLNNLTNRVYAQFYRANRGVNLCLDYAREEEISYDLIIRSRLDLELKPGPNLISWSKLIAKAKTHLVGVRYWQPNGLENKIIIGSSQQMEVYARIWWFLQNLSELQAQEVVLTTVYVPELFIHYENVTDNTSLDLYHRESKSIKETFLKFLDQPENLKIYQRIIPERLLYYYLKQKQVNIHVEDYLIEYQILGSNVTNSKSINF